MTTKPKPIHVSAPDGGIHDLVTELNMLSGFHAAIKMAGDVLCGSQPNEQDAKSVLAIIPDFISDRFDVVINDLHGVK